MVTISLYGAEFFAYHGFYPEEQKLGATFVVDADVSFEPFNKLAQDDIANTVNYEVLYHIVAEQIKQTRKLIETVAGAIAADIKERFPFADRIKVSIKKLNPPLGGKVAYSGIEIII